ncbi:amidohydrolase family protein [Polymorphospora sp. NPDC050346]|uniref:amidohydrolase family protein n=1 Tax=Polymorphospora sp. NPDC050346 TaxID=3155780 RepID=UPI0033F47657
MTGTPAYDDAPDLVVRDVTVVDVEAGAHRPARDVWVAGGRITRIVPTAEGDPPPASARVVDGAGRYLIPGLFDCHVHIAFNGFLGVESDFRRTLKQMLVHGVTQAVDFFTAGGHFPGSAADRVRDDVNEGRFLGPWLLTSYGCLNAPGGFCSCSVGDAASVVVTMDDVREQIDRITAARPDFVKIVYDDVFGTLPNLSPDLLAALIDEAHRRGYRAAVHIATVDDASVAVDCGADIIGHGVIDPMPPELLARMADAGTILIPTLASYESRSLPRWRISLPPAAPPDSVAQYQRQHRSIYEIKDQIDDYARAYDEACANLVPLLDAGVTVVAGSDAGTWYTFPGDALHRELAIYAEQGLAPARVLRMATIDAARAFHLADRFGTVTEGKDANLVLLGADPLADIAAVRAIDAVVLRGRLLDLDALRADITAPHETPPAEIDEEVCSPHHLRTSVH